LSEVNAMTKGPLHFGFVGTEAIGGELESAGD